MVTETRILPDRDSTAQPELVTHPRILIFSASLILKGLAGAVFFGSVDLVNAARGCLALFAGKQVDVPYFPVINAFLWFGGVLSATLAVPFPLSLKLVPILFDSLLAVLIYDLVRRHQPRLALRAGMLYAFSPLALLITSFQGQWDAIALFFLLLAFGLVEDSAHDPRKEVLFGVLFGISLLAKPIGLPFLLLFPMRKRRTWHIEWPAVLGLASAVAIAFLVFGHYGYSNLDRAIEVFAYSAKGVQTFGLPFAPLLSHLHIQALRLWVALPMVVLAVRYHRHKVTALDAMLTFYLCCLATTGLSPQYILWPLPLLLATRRLRLAAFYTAVATAFLLVYYSNPWTSYYASENLGVFAPLRGFSWLIPPAALEKPELLPIVHALGNVVFPVCAMVLAALVLKSAPGQIADGHSRVDGSQGWLSRAAWYSAPFFLIFATILVTRSRVDASQLHSRLSEIWNALPGEYGLYIRSFEPTVVVVRDSAGFAVLNAIVLLGLFAAAWCCFCVCVTWRKMPRAQSDRGLPAAEAEPAKPM